MQNRLAVLVQLRWLFVAIGLVLVGGGVAATIYESTRPERSPIMRYPTAIAVSDEGELFVLSGRSEIRVFTPDGDQVRSWRVDTSSGMAVLVFEKPNVLTVATARNDRRYQYSVDGHLVSSEHDPAAIERIGIRNRDTARGPAGEIYQISDMSVIRRDHNGQQKTVVPGVPTPLRPFFVAGLPPIVFAVQGAVALIVGAALVAQRAQFDRAVAAQQAVAADHQQLG